MIIEVWCLTLISTIPTVIIWFLLIRNLIIYKYYEIKHVAIAQLLIMWSILPVMFITKLLELYKIWPY